MSVLIGWEVQKGGLDSKTQSQIAPVQAKSIKTHRHEGWTHIHTFLYTLFLITRSIFPGSKKMNRGTVTLVTYTQNVQIHYNLTTYYRSL